MNANRSNNPASSMKPVLEKPFISGVILAAGSSTRMKPHGPKQLLRHSEQTLLEHVVHQAAASQLDELIVVLGHEAECVRKSISPSTRVPLRFTVAPDHALGQSRALGAGLAAADPRAEAAAILLGDQPDLPPTTIDLALEAWPRLRPPLLRPEYPDSGDPNQPGHPVVICRKIWPMMMQLDGDQGAREIIRSHPDWLETFPMTGAAPKDIDRIEDWNAWVQSR